MLNLGSKRTWLFLNILAFAVAANLTTATAEPERSGTVYRGLHPGGMWLELGDDGNGSYALSVMDGMPGFAPEPITIPMVADTAGGGCRLIPMEPNVAITVDGCPSGGALSSNISIGSVTGQTIMQPVGWRGSFVWGGATEALGPVRQSCAMQRLRAADGLAGTVLQPALTALATEAAATPSDSNDPVAALPRLRTERLRAYAALQLSPIEAEQAKRIEDAIAGKSVLGRRIGLAEATQQKMEFDARVTNSPQRTQARQQLLQIDRALGEIYDVSASSRRVNSTQKLKAQTAPAALSALKEVLAARQPSRITQLVALEGLAGELDVCLAAITPSTQPVAHTAVRQSLTARAGELAEMVKLAVQGAADSASATAAISPFENNQVIREALQAGGYGEALSSARSRIVQLAQNERKAREEEERKANALAAAMVSGGGRGGSGFNAARVQHSVVFIYLEFRKRGTKYTRRGSGFIVAPNIVVTNSHVVSLDSSAELISPIKVIVNGKTAATAKEANVLSKNDRLDMAILRVPGIGGTAVPIAAQEPSVGSNLWVYGFPAEADLASGDLDDRVLRGDDRPIAASLSAGIVSRVVTGRTVQGGDLGEARLVQYNAVSSGGGSGGPVFDACQRVIAIHAQGNTADLSEFNDGVSTTVLPQLLRDVGVTPAVSNGRC